MLLLVMLCLTHKIPDTLELPAALSYDAPVTVCTVAKEFVTETYAYDVADRRQGSPRSSIGLAPPTAPAWLAKALPAWTSALNDVDPADRQRWKGGHQRPSSHGNTGRAGAQPWLRRQARTCAAVRRGARGRN